MVQEAVSQVLEITFGEKPKILPQTNTAAEINTQIIASIGLSGSLSASLAVGLNQSGACHLVSKMMGSEVKPADQEVVDGVGELVNIISGLIKNKFAELGCVFITSLPTVATAEVALSIRQLLESEGVVLSCEIIGITMDVFFFYSRFGAGQASLSDVISKTVTGQDATQELKKLLTQKPKI